MDHLRTCINHQVVHEPQVGKHCAIRYVLLLDLVNGLDIYAYNGAQGEADG